MISESNNVKFSGALLAGLAVARLAGASEPAPLVLERSIALGDVSGRIDHLTVDLKRERLYIAELGNDRVAVVDLKSAKWIRNLTGMSEPQGILFVATADELYVANGGDGSIRIFRGESLAPAGVIPLAGDADNLRVDSSRNYIVAGYGNGALALIDGASHRVVVDIPLRGHPEGFQLSKDGRRAFINVPDRQQIAVVDMEAFKSVASWPTDGLRANFPMSLETAGAGLWVAFRTPPRLVRFDTTSGAPLLSVQICNDSDDIFIDDSRHRMYVVCGSGNVEIWELRGSRYERIGSVATSPGARTGLFVPELDRLYVAARATTGRPASIQVFRPSEH